MGTCKPLGTPRTVNCRTCRASGAVSAILQPSRCKGRQSVPFQQIPARVVSIITFDAPPARRIGSGFHHPGVSGHPKSAPGSTEIRRRLDSGPGEPAKSLRKSPPSRSGWHKTAQPSEPPLRSQPGDERLRDTWLSGTKPAPIPRQRAALHFRTVSRAGRRESRSIANRNSASASNGSFQRSLRTRARCNFWIAARWDCVMSASA